LIIADKAAEIPGFSRFCKGSGLTPRAGNALNRSWLITIR
jgi:hypothetical protein